MIVERMLELILLEEYKSMSYFKGNAIDEKKYRNRITELRSEFLSQYVIDKQSLKTH